MKMLSKRNVATATMLVLVGTMTAAPALAAGSPPDVVQSVIRSHTGANAPRAAAKETVGTLSVTTGRDKSGKNLESYSQRDAKSVRMMAVITDESQSAVDYTLGLPAGAEVRPQDDGSLIVVRPKGEEAVEVFGAIAKPWATDANGKSLTTSYTYKAGVLTQKVDTTGAAFPVVADPSVQFGFHIVPVAYIQYSRSETLQARDRMTTHQALVTLLCAATDPAAPFCAAAVTIQYGDLRDTVNAAVAVGRCLKLRMPLHPGPQAILAYDAYVHIC